MMSVCYYHVNAPNQEMERFQPRTFLTPASLSADPQQGTLTEGEHTL